MFSRFFFRFHAIYKDPENDIFYLDTQGFFGTDKDLDAAIKSAATVRIVYLEDFQDFSKGFTRVQDAVKLLNRVVLTNDVPVFYLLNRYTPPPGQEAEDFYSAHITSNLILISRQEDMDILMPYQNGQ